MAMDGERGEDGVVGEGTREGIVEKVNELKHTSNSPTDLIQEIVTVIESVAQFGDYRKTQRKECLGLVRRMKHLWPFLEEIRDMGSPIPEKCIACLCSLKKALVMARNLLKTCNEGSKFFLAIEGEAMMIRFHSVYERLSQSLDGLPCAQLRISGEVQEQVELLQSQLRRAKRRTDTQDMELAVDMMVVFSKTDERNDDCAIIKRVMEKLDLHTIEDLKIETIAVRNLIKERAGQHSETTQQIKDVLNRCKQILGMEVSDVLDDPCQPMMLQKCQSLIIPHEFLCPITLEIMTDPVIVASGQTYERESIQKWFESDHWTCPKTRQTLPHLSLAPNSALKNLILQWCDKNNFRLPKKEDAASSERNSTEQKEVILALVEELSSTQLEVQGKAVKDIRMLSKENPENRVLVANCGGIPPLVQLLSYPDSKIQEHAVTALLNLSIDESNKKLISSAGAIAPIIEVLQHGSTEVRENSAAALFSLSMIDENKVTIGLSNGIPPLVELLKNGTIRGKKDALTALFNLSLNQANKARAIDADIVPPLLLLIKDKNLGMVDEALSLFLLLVLHPEGRHEIGQLSFIETLIELIREGTPKNKECACSVLLELCSNNLSHLLAALQYGVYEHLVEMSQNGTNRAQRKANALLQLIRKSEHI